MADDSRDLDLDAAVARHYARDQEGLPPPVEPHKGYASLQDAMLAHRRQLRAQYPDHDRSVPLKGPPVVLPDSPPEE